MNENIIKFYVLTNRLKNKIRTGWIEVEISSERLESVAEHIYGCLMLAIAIDSEYKLDVDMNKVLKMLALHELEETIIKDYTIRDGISPEEKLRLGKEAVITATEGLIKKEEIRDLLDEFNAHKTKESIFAYHIDKIECDFQVKLYDLQGDFKLEKALEDLSFFGDDAERVRRESKTASDVWIEYDKKRYDDDEIFKSLIQDIRKIENDN